MVARRPETHRGWGVVGHGSSLLQEQGGPALSTESERGGRLIGLGSGAVAVDRPAHRPRGARREGCRGGDPTPRFLSLPRPLFFSGGVGGKGGVLRSRAQRLMCILGGRAPNPQGSERRAPRGDNDVSNGRVPVGKRASFKHPRIGTREGRRARVGLPRAVGDGRGAWNGGRSRDGPTCGKSGRA